MRFAVCNEMFQGWAWSQICRFAAETGYDGLEIAPYTLAEDVRELSAEDRQVIRRTAEAHGITIVGLHWLLVSPKGLSVTSPNRGVRDETSRYLVALVDLCADLGGAVMVFGSPAQRRIEDGVRPQEAREWFVQSLLPALDRAADRGVVMCIEPLPRPEANFILTLEEAVSLVREINHPAARTILDVKSASAEGPNVAGLYRRHASVIAHVHANDANRRGPGFGETDFVPILRALADSKYAGYVSVEVFDYSPDPQTIARQSLEYLRRCAAAAGIV